MVRDEETSAKTDTKTASNTSMKRRLKEKNLSLRGPPLSTSFMSLSPSSTAYLIFGLLMSGISSCLTSLNFWVTILNLRSYSLTLKAMPLFPWALLITAAMLLLVLPILSGALLMVLADLHSNTLFFDPIFGGDP